MSKIGRNSPCWCGSGKKYKKCHLYRNEQKKVSVWDVLKNYKSQFGKKYCLCPKEHSIACQGNIINAHTVSKSSSLKAIAKNGHVYSFLLPVEKHAKIKLKNPDAILEPYLSGINKSSTFTGFCKQHDMAIFSPIENYNFIASKEQLFLLTYRSIAREFFGKVAQANLEQSIRECDKGKNVFEQIEHQGNVDALTTGVGLANRDLKYQKDNLDSILINNTYENIEGFVIECKEIPSVMCSGSIFPHYDFQGNRVQNFLDFNARLKSLTLNIISSNGVGYIVFSWLHSDSDVCKDFIASLKKTNKNRVTDAIIRLLFENFENKFASPEWWDSLPRDKQSRLNKKFHISVSLKHDLDSQSLVEDHVKYDNWDIISMYFV